MSRTATHTAAQYRVACAVYATNPTRSLDGARRLLAEIETPVKRADGTVIPGCMEIHHVETLVGDEWLALHIARARTILASDLGERIDGPDGTLIKNSGGWSAETEQARIGRQVTPGEMSVAAFRAAMGPHEHAILSADGRGARYDGWCRCEPHSGADTWVRYERWSARGREAHGYVCPSCRFLVQAG